MTPKPQTSIAIVWVLVTTLPCWATDENINPISTRIEESGNTTSSDECPLIFGNRQDRELNTESRTNNLKSLRIVENFVSIEHFQDWSEPHPIEYKGLEILRTEKKSDLEYVALVRVSEKLQGFDCDPGIYEVYVDDSIGSEASVLGIIPDSILLLHDNQLRHMTVNGADYPIWRMIWISKWKILQLPDSKKRSRHRTKSRSSRRRR